MPSFVRRLEILVRRDPAAAASVLAAAVPHAESDELAALATAAATTRRPAALAAVLARSNEITAGAFDLSTVDPILFREALGQVRIAASPAALGAIIDAIADRTDAALANELPGLLTAEEPEVADRAAAALLELTIIVVGKSGRGTAPSKAIARDRIDRAVTEAARSYRAHRRDAVIVALGVLANRPGEQTTTILQEPDHPAMLALRGVGDLIDSPPVRGNLIRWLGTPALEKSAVRSLRNLGSAEISREGLRDAHLLLAPRRRRALRQVERPLQCLPPVMAAAELPAETQPWLPTLARRLHLSPRARIERLADMIALPSPIARYKAVLALLAERRSDAAEALARFRDDPTLAVARAAAQPGRSRGEPAPVSAWGELAVSGHEPLRRRAASLLARRRFHVLRKSWRAMEEAAVLAAARRLLATDTQDLVDGLREVLTGGKVQDQLRAVMLARRLGIVPEVEAMVLSLAQCQTPHLASAAVIALPAGRRPERFEAMTNALDHPDVRIRANATEAIGHTARHDLIQRLTPLLDSPANRLRANAARATLRVNPRQAVEALRSMLADARPLHRISAIWAARAGRTTEAAPLLRALARNDGSAEIRIRAATALRHLQTAGRRAAPSPIQASS